MVGRSSWLIRRSPRWRRRLLGDGANALIGGSGIFIAPDGHDANDGSIAEPLATPHEAVDRAEPGDTIYNRDRTFNGELQQYNFDDYLWITKGGVAGAPIRMLAYPGEQPIWDFSNVPWIGVEANIDGNPMVSLTGTGGDPHASDYWVWNGITIQAEKNNPALQDPHRTGVALLVTTSHHWMERLVVRWIGGNAVQVRGKPFVNPVERASHNTFLNFDVYECFDPISNGNYGTGFQTVWGIGPGNRVIGLRVWHCSDHGWSGWECLEEAIFEDCWGYANGINLWNWPTWHLGADGNGTKTDIQHAPIRMIRCLMWDNESTGIAGGLGRLNYNGEAVLTDGYIADNCTFFNNKGRNIFHGSLINWQNPTQIRHRNSVIVDTLGKSWNPVLAHRTPGPDLLLATCEATNCSFKVDELDQSAALAKWTFDDSIAAESIGDLNFGTVSNVVQAAGRIGQAANFALDATEPHLIRASSPAIELDGSFTISAWVLMHSLPNDSGSDHRYVFAKGSPAGVITGWEWALRFSGTYSGGNPHFRFTFFLGDRTANSVSIQSDRPFTDGLMTAWEIDTWYWVVCRYDAVAQQASITINGIWINTVSTASLAGLNPSGSIPLRVGTPFPGFQHWRGMIDELTIFDGLPSLTNIATPADFLSLDDTIAKGPRQADGSLPASKFLRLKGDSPLINAGIDIGLPYQGSAPDIGAYEHPE